MFLYFFLGLFLWFFTAGAVLVNVTIDDTKGDPLTGASVIYTPPDAWNSGSSSCHHCLVRPDSKELVDQTWHDSTFSVNADNDKHPNVPLTASVSFNGSAVYVFCAISRSSTDPNGDSDMTFYIDGVLVGAFNPRAIGSAGYEYGVPVYVNTAMAPGPHNFTLQNGHQNGYQSLVILDSIVYSYDNGQPAASHVDSSSAASSAPASTSRGTTLAVVAALVSALVLILIAIGIFLYRRRRHRREIYARYMPNGSISAFPISLTPSVTPTPSFIAAPSPVYGGASSSRNRSDDGGGSGHRWVGSSSSAGLRGYTTHRPYADLDPAQAFQRPQRWEHIAPVR